MKNRALFAGSWYTDQADTLRSELSSLLEKSPKRSYIAKGAILPHAGLMFSGKGMAHFFKNLDPDIERVVVMAPSHYNYLVPGKIYYGRFEAHETPFGDIGGEMIEPEDDCFVQDNSAVEQEHAAEMFYPFIRFARENASLLVLLIPEISDSSTLETLSARLMETLSKSGDMSKTVFIASSDFTHYGPRFGYVPFGIGSSEDRVADMDRRYADYLAEFRFDTLFEKGGRSRRQYAELIRQLFFPT